MFRKKNNEAPPVPIAVSFFRIVHGVLFCYAAAIILVAVFLNETVPLPLWISPERIFAFAVAGPMILGSFFFCLATAIRGMFTPGVFFCSFLAFTLAALPTMTTVFFPAHLVLFGLAAVYGVSGLILVRFLFAQPLPKKK